MKKKKIMAIAAIIVAIFAAAVAFFEFSGIKEDIKNKAEEKKMWESIGTEAVEHINGDSFFTDSNGKISSWEIMKNELTYDENGNKEIKITFSCETEKRVLQIYASKYGEGNWRYHVESVLIK